MQFEKLVFVDLETTGTNPVADRITEIGLVEVDAAGKATHWSSLVNPGVGIPAFIQSLTGISNDMVRDAPTFDELARPSASTSTRPISVMRSATGLVPVVSRSTKTSFSKFMPCTAVRLASITCPSCLSA